MVAHHAVAMGEGGKARLEELVGDDPVVTESVFNRLTELSMRIKSLGPR